METEKRIVARKRNWRRRSVLGALGILRRIAKQCAIGYASKVEIETSLELIEVRILEAVDLCWDHDKQELSGG